MIPLHIAPCWSSAQLLYSRYPIHGSWLWLPPWILSAVSMTVPSSFLTRPFPLSRVSQLWRNIWGLETPPCLEESTKDKGEGWLDRLVVGEARNVPKDKRARMRTAVDGMVDKVCGATLSQTCQHTLVGARSRAFGTKAYAQRNSAVRVMVLRPALGSMGREATDIGAASIT